MIGYLLLNILIWLVHMVDNMLMLFPFMVSATNTFNNLLGYLDLLVLYIRPLFPYTSTLIFQNLSNYFYVWLVFVFIGLVKRFIPFYGSTKTNI